MRAQAPRAVRRVSVFPFLASALLAVSACRGTVPIGTLLDDPARYDGETVRVRGTVAESVGALGRGLYRVSDETGTLGVLSARGGAPRQGARVGVEGEFKALFTFGDQSQAILLEDRRFNP